MCITFFFKVRKKKISGMFTKCFTYIIMVAMATYCFSKIFQIKPIFLKIIIKVRKKKKKYQECSRNVLHILSWLPWQHIFFSKIFQIKPIFFLNYFYSKNVQKMLYTYYHGCYGNIFFSHFFCEI